MVIKVNHHHRETEMFYNKFKQVSPKSLNTFLIICSLSCAVVVAAVIYINKTPEYCFPEDVQKNLNDPDDVDGIESELDAAAADVLKRSLMMRNDARTVHNLAEFGPLRADTPVLVVTVRRQLPQLRALLAALAQLSGVDELLLVFSHAHYHPAIDRLVRQIDFCMLLQIYFPHSVQLHPHRFPGPEEAANGTRDAAAAERKHHWWWTAHHVFDHLLPELPGPAQRHGGLVVFIDEANYVLPDFTFMLSIAKYSLTNYFPEVDVVALGRPPPSAGDYAALTVEAWRPPLAGGLALDRSTWRRIAARGRHYCDHDDDSWSGSLLRVFARFPRGYALALALQVPRVLGADARGVRVLCEHLFPRAVRAVLALDRGGALLAEPELLPRATGTARWTDRRDRALCHYINKA